MYEIVRKALLIFILLGILLIIITLFAKMVSSPTVVTPRNIQITSEGLLALHAEVLETIKWLTSLFIGLVTVSGIASFLYGSMRVRLAEEQLSSMNEHSKQLQEEINWQSEQLQKLQQSASDLEKNLLVMEKDIGVTAYTAALYQIETYGLNLVDLKNRRNREMAKQKLIQLSQHNDPVIRLACLRAFAQAIDYSVSLEHFNSIEGHLQKMTSNREKYALLQLAAIKLLENLRK
jgi:hypothetical protein